MHQLITLTLLVFLVGCPTDETLENPDPSPSDDDDSTETPMEGDWVGAALGVVLYGSQGQYPCEGLAEASVDDNDRATGSIDCTFPHTGDVCTFSWEELWVNGGQRSIPVDACFGSGEGTYSMWLANGHLYGKAQRLSPQISVELGWTLELVP